MESFVVIGLGRFGSAVAERLCQEGHQVLAVDVDEKVVQNMADKVTQAVAGDCQEMDVLRALGVQDMNCAVVAFSNDIGKSVLVTLNLKELGVPRIICKARTATHEELLRRIGADKVVFPERESGWNLAQALSNREILNYVGLAEGYGIVKLDVPLAWVGKTIGQLQIRKKYQVNIIAVQRSGGGHPARSGGEPFVPKGRYDLQPGQYRGQRPCPEVGVTYGNHHTKEQYPHHPHPQAHRGPALPPRPGAGGVRGPEDAGRGPALGRKAGGGPLGPGDRKSVV